MSDSHINSFALELSGYAAHVGLSIVIGKQYPGLHYAGGANKLLRCHGVRLVAWEEGNINILDA